jgi:hypothetical protein
MVQTVSKEDAFYVVVISIGLSWFSPELHENEKCIGISTLMLM